MIRQSVSGLAIRSCTLIIGARSDAKPVSTFADRAPLPALRMLIISGTSRSGGSDEHPKAAADRYRLRRGVPVVLHRQAPDRERAGAGGRCAGGDSLAAVLSQQLGAARGDQPRRIPHREVRLA